ncbi:MAG: DUF411 domain-containing protein, partial [Propionivibrio sp.]
MHAILRSTLFVLVFSSGSVLAQTPPSVDLHKSPTCDCCAKWANHMSKSGFKVNVHVVDDVPGARKKLGMPNELGSCHTAKIGNYIVEGHVPAADIQRLLNEKPEALGLAVPA